MCLGIYYNENQLKAQLYKSLQHVKLFLAAVENRIKNERRVLRTFDNIHYVDSGNQGEQFKGDHEKEKNRENIELSKIRHKFLTRGNNIVSRNIEVTTAINLIKDRNMQQAIDKWVKNGNAHTQFIPTFKPAEEIKQSHFQDCTVPTNFPGASPDVRKVVDEWIQSITKPGSKTQNLLTKAYTPQNGNQISTHTIIGNIQRPKNLRDQNKTENNIKNEQSTKDPFGMDFDYGGTTNGGGFAFTSPQQLDTPSTRRPISPYVKELIEQMSRRRVGYYTVFLTRFFEITSVMHSAAIAAFTSAVKEHLNDLKNNHKLDSLGEPALSGLLSLADKAEYTPDDEKRTYASDMTMVMVNTEVFIAKNIRDLLQAADALYNKEEGEKLFATLEYLSQFPNEYPNGNRTAMDIAKEMVEATLSPLDRLAGTRKRREFITALNNLVQENFPDVARRRIVHDYFTSTTVEIDSSKVYDYRRMIKLKNDTSRKRMKIEYNRDYRKMRKMNRNNGTNKRRFHIHRRTTKNTFKIKPTIVKNQNMKRISTKYKNSLLRKIVEASSYSDEEKYLRANLYNAFQNKNKYLE